jgi:outer membrane lipoprotein-sorting protein
MRKFQPMTSRRRLTTLAGGLILSAAALDPASAQNPFEFLLGRNPSGSQSTAPATPSKMPPPSAAASGMPTTAILPPKRPSPRPEEAVTPQSPAGQAAQTASSPASKAAPEAIAGPLMIAQSKAPAGPLSETQIVERGNAYFNSITSLAGDFVQIGGDGRRLTGKLFLQRPGKIRFEYDAPATLEVVADGSSVAVRDRKLATQDLYSIGQTPLKFLLRERIDLGRDLKITEVAPENDGTRIAVEDKSTLGGTSKITLYFDKDVRELRRWRIIDPQGFQTTVSLANLERNPRIEQALFTIDYQRILGGAKD